MSKMNVEKTDLKEQVDKKQFHMPRILIVYDMLVYLIATVLLLVLYEGNDKLTTSGIFQQVVLSAGCIFAVRMAGKIYGQVWRYGGIQCYIRLLSTDAIAFIIYLLMELCLPVEKITFVVQMQDDFDYWFDMAKCLFAGEYGKIDYEKGEKTVEMLLVKLAKMEVSIKNRLKELCDFS